MIIKPSKFILRNFWLHASNLSWTKNCLLNGAIVHKNLASDSWVHLIVSYINKSSVLNKINAISKKLSGYANTILLTTAVNDADFDLSKISFNIISTSSKLLFSHSLSKNFSNAMWMIFNNVGITGEPDPL